MSPDLVIAGLAVLAGLVALVLGADRFVDGAAELAHRLGVPPLIVGMVIIGLGTSAPEILVSATASMQGAGAIAVGNAVGSDISNIGLVLGLTAIFAPMDLEAAVVRREIPILLGITALTGVLLADGELGRLDGVFLLVTLAAVLARSMLTARRAREVGEMEGAKPPADGEAVSDNGGPWWRAPLWLLVGLGLLALGSRLVVGGASTIASALGLSELMIGLTVVALGTSLPELAATLTSARRGEHGLAIGNVLGSNVFNLVAVLPLPALIAPGPVAPELLRRDLVALALLSAALFVFARGWHPRSRLNRLEGGALLSIFVAYMAWLVLSELGAASSAPGW